MPLIIKLNLYNFMKDFIAFLKVASVFVLAAIAIITNVAVWNAAKLGAENVTPFIVWVSVFNFILEGVGIYFYQKLINAFGKKEEKVEEPKKNAK